MKKQFRFEDLLKGAPPELLKGILREIEDLPENLRNNINHLSEDALLDLTMKYIKSQTLSSSMASWIRIEQKEDGNLSLVLIGKAVDEIPFENVFSDNETRAACLEVSSFCFGKTSFSSQDLSRLDELKKKVISLVNENYPDLNYSGLRLTEDKNRILVCVSTLETQEFDSLSALLEIIKKDILQSIQDPTSPFGPFSTIP